MMNQDIRYTLQTNNFLCMLLMKYKINMLLNIVKFIFQTYLIQVFLYY